MPTIEFPFWVPFTYQITPVSGAPVTATVKVVVLPPDTETAVGDTVTVVVWFPPPLPLLLGLLAMHPAKGNTTAAITRQDMAENKDLRTGPSGRLQIIETIVGRRREVYSATAMLSRPI